MRQDDSCLEPERTSVLSMNKEVSINWFLESFIIEMLSLGCFWVSKFNPFIESSIAQTLSKYIPLPRESPAVN